MRWQYPDELEADFQQYYGLDIAAVEPARAARLLFQLPRDCRVFVAISPPNQWGWSEVFANKLTYLMELMLWQNSYNGKNKSKHKNNKPKPFIPEFMKPPKELSNLRSEVESHTVDDIRSILEMPRG